MQETIETTLTVTSHDLSIWGLFLAADIVKAVMLMLVIASLWTWAIIFEKLRTIGREFRYADDFEDEFGQAVRWISSMIPSALNLMASWRGCFLRRCGNGGGPRRGVMLAVMVPSISGSGLTGPCRSP